jgi:hypothetical protein
MRTQLLIVLSLALVGSLAGVVSAYPDDGVSHSRKVEQAREPAARVRIELRGNLLSVWIRNAPWEQVLNELRRQTGVTIQVLGPMVGTVTQEFQALPLEQGLLQLFGDADIVLSPAKEAQPGMAAKSPIHVWLIPKKGSVRKQGQAPSPGVPSGPQEEAPESAEQIAGENPEEPAQEDPVGEPVLPEEPTEVEVQEQEPASEVAMLDEEGNEVEQSSAALPSAPQEEAPESADQLAGVDSGEPGQEEPAEEPAVQEEAGTEVEVQEQEPASEVVTMDEEGLEVEQ